ncbi:EamA family transporter [Nesterenkonia halotolerans]|uniref:Inner membrane transporter RhtA n=1 Tax=Nesterenkonia halotolerans TaxID=225325 RepID=A0ABR9J433_9MICC|nr:EamA family transporter [Nesterenkonia halotolerans]MBE1513752.1 inner membrane transporter RhtA [Nesterenkonia halotolerans]
MDSAASPLEGRPGRGLMMISASALSTQSGAAVGSLAFSTFTPVGVVAARQVVASVVLCAIARPRFWRFTGAQWWAVALLAFFFAGMNTALYSAVDRIGLGTAVTIEFLGPLAVALLSSRRGRDLFCALLALGGVVLLTRPGPTSDLLGLGLAAAAAMCWAGYILTNRLVGKRVPGVQGTAVATLLSSAAMVPIAVAILWNTTIPAEAFLYAAVAGLLATAVPYALDLIVLRHITPLMFGLGMSLNPLFAAVVGAVFLREEIDSFGWLGIVLVVLSNGLTLLGKGQLRRRGRMIDLQADGSAVR